MSGQRVAGFDLLRGLCAIAVVVYHVHLWSGALPPYNWGTYAVYAFFVLSGASMVVAYADRMAAGLPVTRFLALRLARLAPLFLLVLAASLGWRLLQHGLDAPRLGYAFLNLVFQFGLGNPGATSQVIGGWSLGIEFLFYLLFPVLLALTASRAWPWLLALAFASQQVFVNLVLQGATSLEAPWNRYTQFLAFVFYFAGGCAIGHAVRAGLLRPRGAGLPVTAVLLGVLAFSNGATIVSSLTGWAGIGLSLVTATVVAASATLRLSGWGEKLAELLGRASYGVYLLHPLLIPGILGAARRAGLGLPWVLAGTLAVAIVAALVLERWFEQPVQRAVRRAVAPTLPSPAGGGERRA